MIYLNYAALCPPYPEAHQAMLSTLEEFQGLLYSEAGLQWYRRNSRDYRKRVADFLNVADASTLAFVPNASMACRLICTFIEWQPGDRIVTSTHENPSIQREMRWLQPRGVDVQSLQPQPSPQAFLDHLDRMTHQSPVKAILLSHVSHVDGRIFPIREISRLAKHRNILLLVDGAQAVGHIPVDLREIDADVYFFPGHKWCRGPLGTGALVVQPHLFSHHSGFDLTLPEQENVCAERFEIGTSNIGLITGLATACSLKQREGLGTETLHESRNLARDQVTHCQALHLHEWDGPHAPGILTFHCDKPEDHAPLVHHLTATQKIIVKSFSTYPAEECPAIRFSWCPSTPNETLDWALTAVRKFLSNHKKGKTDHV